MTTAFTLASLYLIAKFLVPLGLVALAAYVAYHAFTVRPADRHTFASALPEDRLDDPEGLRPRR